MQADNWLDVSIEIYSGMVHWPNNPGVKITRVRDTEKGDHSTLSHIDMGSHTGTHVDAPLHFLKDGCGVDKMPLDLMMGKTRVIRIKDEKSIKAGELKEYDIKEGECIFFKTKNSPAVWRGDDFKEDFVYITEEAGEYLALKKVRLVGVDYLSVGSYKKGGKEVHRLLLEAGAWIIEGLNLTEAPEGECEYICLPLKIKGGDGAPSRVLLKHIPSLGLPS